MEYIPLTETNAYSLRFGDQNLDSLQNRSRRESRQWLPEAGGVTQLHRPDRVRCLILGETTTSRGYLDCRMCQFAVKNQITWEHLPP